MRLLKSWNLPVKTVSEANCTEHWTKKHKRHKLQKRYIDSAFSFEKPVFPPILHIHLTRISSRELDKEENLPASFKYIKDYIANNLRPGLAPGRADNDKNLSWQFSQQKGKPQHIKIDFYSDN